MITQFKKDLEIGQTFERLSQDRIIKYYESKYNVIEICEDYRYDFKLSNNMTYEIKYERLSLKTGNVFIEYMAFNKKSGIDKTIADYYIIVLPINHLDNHFLLIEVEALKNIISNKKYSRKHTDKLKSGYIFSKDEIIKNGIFI